MRIARTLAQLLVVCAVVFLSSMLILGGWGGHRDWTDVAALTCLVALLLPSSLLRRSKLASSLASLVCIGMTLFIVIGSRMDLPLASIVMLLGILAKPVLIVMCEIEKRRASNKVLEDIVAKAPNPQD